MAPTFALGRAIPPKRTVEFALSPGAKKALMALGATGGTAAAAKMGRDEYKKSKEEGLPSRALATGVGTALGLAGGAVLGDQGRKKVLVPLVQQGEAAAETLMNLHRDFVRHGKMSPDEAARKVKGMTGEFFGNPGFQGLPRQVEMGMAANKEMDRIVPKMMGLGGLVGGGLGLTSAMAHRDAQDRYAQSALAGKGYALDPDGTGRVSESYLVDKRVPLAQRQASLRAFMERDSENPVSYAGQAGRIGLSLVPLGATAGLHATGSGKGMLAGAGLGAAAGAGLGLLDAHLTRKQRGEFAAALKSGDEKKINQMLKEEMDFQRDMGVESPRLRKNSKRRQEVLKSSMKKQSSADPLSLFRLLAPA